jgi:ribosome-associated toxin RatA of RatAB toxin-antitoxin module
VSQYRQSYTTTIARSARDCFAALVDFERYPDWSSPITVCRVLERHPDGLAKRVEFELNMTIKTIRYVLEYTYEPPHGADWHLIEGDLNGVEGSYRFEEGPDGCRTTCSQAIDLGFWVPGFIRSTFEQRALQESVEEFRRAVEAVSA